MDGDANAILRHPRETVLQPLPRKPSRPNAAAGNWLRQYGLAYRPYIAGLLALIGLVAVWDFLTVEQINLYVRFFNLPTPAQVLNEAELAYGNTTFLTDIVISCRRILIGFGLAALVAVPLGIAMGRFLLLKEIIFPISEVLRPIPAIAWVPMSIMIWPTTEESIVFITFLGSFFPILVNTLHGMAALDPILVRAARCLGARERSMFLEIYLPGVLPHIFTGFTVGMGVAWVSLIAAEMIAGQYGIGYFTWEAYSLIQYPDIVLGMITIGVLGLLFSGAIVLTGRLLMPWNSRH